GASAFLTMWSAGQSTVVEFDAWTTGWFVALALAVFGYSLHESSVVGLVTCTLAEPLAARSPKPHVSASAAMLHARESSAHAMPLPVGSGSLSVTPVAVAGPPFVTVIV